jgi:carbonic anhydrase
LSTRSAVKGDIFVKSIHLTVEKDPAAGWAVGLLEELAMLTTEPLGWIPYVLLVAAAALAPPNSQAQWKTHWEYEGPTGADHWSELDPAYATCNVGKEQSPINIQNAEKAQLPSLRFVSKIGPLNYLVNNGHTIRVNYHDAPGTGNLLIVEGKSYQLTQFHFHRPSEEYIHGKPFDMVVHLMYQSRARRPPSTVAQRARRARESVTRQSK